MTLVPTQADDPPLPALDRNAPGLPGERPTEAIPIPPEYRRAFSVVAFTMNRFIIDHVLRSARFFDDDAELMVLFGMLAHLNATPVLLPGSRPSTTLGRNGRVPDAQRRMRPVRVRDLVQITRRPRETIRRRLDRLEASGRIVRLVDGYVLNLDSVEDGMTTLTLDGARRFVEAARVIEAALRDAERVLAKEAAEADLDQAPRS